MPVSLNGARGAANGGSAGPVPQKRLIALLDYIEQVEKLGRKPTFVVPTGYFCQYEEDLRGLPSLEFDCGGEGDEVWLRVPRLKEKDPPPPGEALTPWVVLSKSLDKPPQLRSEITVPAAKEGESPVTLPLEDAPQIRPAFDAYVRGPWTGWADYERPRRKTIAFYNQLFKLEQVMEAEGVETPIELVWGIGMALWEAEKSTHIRHPLITQAAEISLDPVSLALEVRPRDRLPTLEIDAYVALDNPGVPSVEAAWKAMLEQGESTISPFDESSFRTLLGAAAGYLDANGRYYPEVRGDPEDRRLPRPGPDLTITDTWVLFARNRSSNFLLDDLARLRANLEELESVPGGPAALVSELPTEVVERPDVVLRGLSHGGSAMPAGVKPLELYFPKPYNEEQVSIVEKLEVSDGVVVQGPPGTGKTHTIANVICHYLANGKRVLVTSKGEPALAVLRAQIPEGVRALTVSLLTDEKDGMRQFEHAVQTIAATVSQLHPSELTREIEALGHQVDQLHARLATVDQELAKWAKYHTEPIRFHGREWTAQALAQFVVENEKAYGWLTDTLEPRAVEPQFTDADIASLRRARTILGKDLAYLSVELPVADSFPDGKAIGELHQDLVRGASMAEEMRTDGLPPLANARSETLEKAQALFALLAEALATFDETYRPQHPFTERLRAAYRTESPALSGLNELVSLVHTLERERQRFVQKPLEVPPDVELDVEFVEAVTLASQGKNPLGLLGFMKGALKAKLAAVTVSGLPPEGAADWQAVVQFLSLRKRARTTASRWNANAREFQLPQVAVTGAETLRQLSALATHISTVRRLARECDSKLPALIGEVFGEAVSRADLYSGREPLAHVHEVLSKHLACNRLGYAKGAVADLIAKLAGKGGAVCDAIRTFLTESLGDAGLSPVEASEHWSGFLAELRRLASLRGSLSEVARVAWLVESSGARGWANGLRTVPAVNDDPWTPADWLEAWQWRCASTFLQAIDARERLKRLQGVRQETEEGLAKTYQRLVEKKTWVEVHRNSPASVKGALQAFLNAIKHIGKGKGIRAVRYRKEAREAMFEAYRAVPCWVMPQWRASESLPAEIGKFDLVVIDEASQSDLWALPCLLRGRKLLVVGDDKQVSPDAIGLKEDDINNLKQRFLREQVHGDQMTPEKSLYDLAKVVFAGEMVVLREHFRCVAPIIEFSKREFYNHKIMPLRVPKASERLDPPLVDVLVRGGSRDGKVNTAEARAIVAEVKTVLSDPRCERKTIGVVSLLGIEQAHHIYELLRKHIPEEDMVARQITVGDARTFQGKERDIMMLSMVATPEQKMTATGAIYEQRFNVAASRARDRMYLFRSVELVDLNPADLKAKLIAHFTSPFHQDPVRVKDLRMRCESGFEREMFDELTGKGYRVTTQVPAGGYRIDMVVEGADDRRLAIECDGDQFHGPGQWQADMARQRVLERAGWTFWRCFASSFTLNKSAVLEELVASLARMGIEPIGAEAFDQSVYTEHRKADPLDVGELDEEAGDGSAAGVQSDAPAPPAPVTPEIRRRSPRRGDNTFSEQALAVFLSEHGLRSEDLRPKNGALWVTTTGRETPGVAQQLRAWGFQLRQGRGWWRR